MEKYNKIKILIEIIVATFIIHSKVTVHAKYQQNVINNQAVKVKTNTETTRIMELAERDFKRALINMLSDLKRNMNIMRRKVEDV